MESKILEILSLVLQHYETAASQTHIPVMLDKRDMRSAHKTATYMHNHLAHYPSTEFLARLAGMSVSRYLLAFRKLFGTTPYEYLKELRMNHALTLLGESDYSIGAVAAKVGYTHAGHFSGLFKKVYGVTPKQYRNMHGLK